MTILQNLRVMPVDHCPLLILVALFRVSTRRGRSQGRWGERFGEELSGSSGMIYLWRIRQRFTHCIMSPLPLAAKVLVNPTQTWERSLLRCARIQLGVSQIWIVRNRSHVIVSGRVSASLRLSSSSTRFRETTTYFLCPERLAKVFSLFRQQRTKVEWRSQSIQRLQVCDFVYLLRVRHFLSYLLQCSSLQGISWCNRLAVVASQRELTHSKKVASEQAALYPTNSMTYPRSCLGSGQTSYSKTFSCSFHSISQLFISIWNASEYSNNKCESFRVFRAVNLEERRVAACKVVTLTPETTERERKMLDKEMRVHWTLKHVNVLEFINAFVVEPDSSTAYHPGLYMLLEIAAGGDLFDKIGRFHCPRSPSLLMYHGL